MVKSRTVLRHLSLWLIYIAFEVGYLHVTLAGLASFSHFLVYYAFNIGLFYLHALVLLNYAFFKSGRPYLVAVLLIVPEILSYLGIKVLLDAALSLPARTVSDVLHLGKPYWMANLWRGLNFIGLSTAYFSTLYMIHFRDQTHLAEKQRLESAAARLELENRLISAENAYLHHQISPHLLFNTLNFVYNAVEEHSEKAARGIAHLADLMRYALVSTEDQQPVPLSEEIRQVENLIALSRLRFGEHFALRFEHAIQADNVSILPLVLITLVENMVKHGSLADPAFPAVIDLNVSGQRLTLVTVNRKAPAAAYLRTGIGLKNLEKRLQNHYPSRYRLTIDDRDSTFAVTLKINL
jgi:hypothetical protein